MRDEPLADLRPAIEVIDNELLDEIYLDLSANAPDDWKAPEEMVNDEFENSDSRSDSRRDSSDTSADRGKVWRGHHGHSGGRLEAASGFWTSRMERSAKAESCAEVTESTSSKTWSAAARRGPPFKGE